VGGFEQRLKVAGLRVTQPRLAVLSVLDRADEEGEHLVVAEVAHRSREIVGRVSTQAVYDCLDALAAGGVVRRVQLPGSPARYETRVGDNHHHLVCLACGTISNVDCAAASAPCLHPSTAQDFDVALAEVVYWGTCATCAAASTRQARARMPR
jgi:Fur family ferric uptake transcriptional regulator